MASNHQAPNYNMVFIALTVLTAVEIGVVFMPISKIIVGIALILLALVKASLVALYFMHLKYEKFALGIVALSPLLICALLIIGLLPDLAGTKHQTKVSAAAQVESGEQVISGVTE